MNIYEIDFEKWAWKNANVLSGDKADSKFVNLKKFKFRFNSLPFQYF